MGIFLCEKGVFVKVKISRFEKRKCFYAKSLLKTHNLDKLIGEKTSFKVHGK